MFRQALFLSFRCNLHTAGNLIARITSNLSEEIYKSQATGGLLVYLPIHPHCRKAVRPIEFRPLIVSPDFLINGRYVLLDIKFNLIPIHRREGVSEPHTLRSDSSPVTCELSEKPSSEVEPCRRRVS